MTRPMLKNLLFIEAQRTSIRRGFWQYDFQVRNSARRQISSGMSCIIDDIKRNKNKIATFMKSYRTAVIEAFLGPRRRDAEFPSVVDHENPP